MPVSSGPGIVSLKPEHHERRRGKGHIHSGPPNLAHAHSQARVHGSTESKNKAWDPCPTTGLGHAATGLGRGVLHRVTEGVR